MAGDPIGLGRRILIVDDAALTRVHLKHALQRMGFEVIEAANGAEAVVKYRAVRPDAVFMDIHMPQMDGVAALRELRRIDSRARVAILSSSNDRSAAAKAAKSFGAADFLVKPWREARLRAALGTLLGIEPPPGNRAGDR